MTRIVVGINRTQDGSIAVARGEDEVYSLQKERISRRKHHWGRLGDLPDRYLPHMPLLKETVDLVVEGYSSDAEIAHLADYHEELRETLSLREDTPIIRVSHHLTHLYSAFPPSPFQEAAGLVVDAQGSPVRDFTEPVELPPAPARTCWRSAPSTGANAAGSNAWPSSSGTATGRARPGWAASTPC
ncbi:hypothetical protein [Thermocatellispora tengchongensis]|uniref:hypothetical protein n=1 Tax=Thermocatellispora tengchongensis TaxID=1073253 RepID=UPI003628B9B5